MNATTVAVDLAKEIFELAEVSERGVARMRLKRRAFFEYLATRPLCCLVMEACGGAHHVARKALAHGHTVRMLPAQYVRAYRRRNKTDRADCSALLEAVKNAEILPVPVKSVEQQAIQGVHRIRSQWMAARTARINTARGLLRELGFALPEGAASALKQLPEAISSEAVPPMLKQALEQVLTEIHQLEARIDGVDAQLARVSRADPVIQGLQQIPGIGPLTSTAIKASAGDARHFRSGRHFAAWLGLTPRESSSAMKRHLGAISKRGDVYVRTLLTHGARSVLARASQLQRTKPESLSRIQIWALAVQQRRGHNKATCALANKLARIAWATWRYQTEFNPDHAVATA